MLKGGLRTRSSRFFGGGQGLTHLWTVHIALPSIIITTAVTPIFVEMIGVSIKSKFILSLVKQNKFTQLCLLTQETPF